MVKCRNLKRTTVKKINWTTRSYNIRFLITITESYIFNKILLLVTFRQHIRILNCQILHDLFSYFIVIMEKLPSFVLRLSLEEISLRRVVVNLWNETDTLASIAKIEELNDGERKNAWKETVEDKVKAKVSELVVPEALKKQMMLTVKPIGSEIQKWKMFHAKYLSYSTEEFGVPILEKICWTCTGTVEYQKTAEQLIRCGMLDIAKRYKLACLYCLEDYIPIWWEELPEEIKRTFYNEDTSHIRKPHLQFCWPYILKGEGYKLDNILGSQLDEYPATFNRAAFEYSSFTGNKAAAQYFLQKLTNEGEKAPVHLTTCGVAEYRILMKIYKGSFCFPDAKRTDVLCYLLPLITPEQRIEAIRKQPISFLCCFLYWPWQNLFLEIADLIWPYLSESHYDELLICMRYALMSSGCYFPELFQEFFTHSPLDFKKYFVHGARQFVDFFSIFIDNDDSESIKVIFRNIESEDRMMLLCSCSFFKVLDKLLVRDKWHLVEVCLREATLTKEGRDNLKRAFRRLLTIVDTLALKPKKLSRFFQLLNEIYGSDSKRSSEAEALTKAKELAFRKFFTEIGTQAMKPHEWERFFEIRDEIHGRTTSKRSAEVETLTEAKKNCAQK